MAVPFLRDFLCTNPTRELVAPASRKVLIKIFVDRRLLL